MSGKFGHHEHQLMAQGGEAHDGVLGLLAPAVPVVAVVTGLSLGCLEY